MNTNKDAEYNDNDSIFTPSTPVFQMKGGVLRRRLGKTEVPLFGMAKRLMELRQMYPQSTDMWVEYVFVEGADDDTKTVVLKITDFREVGKELEKATGTHRKWNSIWKGLTRQGFVSRKVVKIHQKTAVKLFVLDLGEYIENVAGKAGSKRKSAGKNRRKRVSYNTRSGKEYSATLSSHLLRPSVTADEQTQHLERLAEEERRWSNMTQESKSTSVSMIPIDDDEFLPRTQDLREMFARKTRGGSERGNNNVVATKPSDLLKNEARPSSLRKTRQRRVKAKAKAKTNTAKKKKRKRQDVENAAEMEGDTASRTRTDSSETDSTVDEMFEERNARMAELGNLASRLFKDEFVNITVNINPRRRSIKCRASSKRVRTSLVVSNDGVEEEEWEGSEGIDGEWAGHNTEVDCREAPNTPRQKMRRSLFQPRDKIGSVARLFDNDRVFKEVSSMGDETGFGSMYDDSQPAWYATALSFPYKPLPSASVF